MTTFYLKHHLYPDNPQLFVVDAKQIIKLVGESNTAFWQNRRGEPYWEIVIYTSGVDSSGDSLGPYWIDTIGTEQTIHELINGRVNSICQEIDWSKSAAYEDDFEEQEDRYAPVIDWSYPSNGQIDVPIAATIIIRLKDFLPAKGIDINTLVFKVNGYTVLPTVTGNKYDYTLSYKPQIG